MKHKMIDDVNVNVSVDIDTQDVEALVEVTGKTMMDVIGFWAAATTIRYIIKTLVK